MPRAYHRLAIGALLLAAGPLSAQTFPTDDPVIKQIWSMGMENSKTWDLAHTLFDSLGPRLMGAPNL